MVLSKILATGIVAASVLAGSTTAAQAAGPGIPHYSDGNIYLFEHTQWGGGRCYTDGNRSDYRQFSHCFAGNGLNDKVSSAFNNGFPSDPDDILFFEHPGYRGAALCLHQGVGYPDLHYFGWGDRISSHRWVNAC